MPYTCSSHPEQFTKDLQSPHSSCQAPLLSHLCQVLRVSRELQPLEAFKQHVEKLFVRQDGGHQPRTEIACRCS